MPATTRHLVICSAHPFCAELVSGLRTAYGVERVWSLEDLVDAASLIRRFAITDLYWLQDCFSFDRRDDTGAGWTQAARNWLKALDLVKRTGCRIFYPSTIAVFGPDAPRVQCPNDAPQNPPGVFGLFKRASERWCEQYFQDFGVDVRCLRFPVLLQSRSASDQPPVMPILMNVQPRPAMLVTEAVRAVIELMSAPGLALRHRRCYNLAGLSMSLQDLPSGLIEIWNLPEHPGPLSLDDSAARADWGWQLRHNMEHLVQRL